MNEERYRLNSRKHYRTNTEPGDRLQPKLQIYVRGDVLVPTDDELKQLPHIFEGPVEDAVTVPGTGRQQVVEELQEVIFTVREQAVDLLKRGETRLRDVIRQAPQDLLEAMLEVEGSSQKVRPRVIDMIERRLKVAVTT